MKTNGKYIHLHHQKRFENRPTLVFLHDSLGCVQLWRDFPQMLAAAVQCNVLVYDRLGYGQSDAMPTPVRATDYMELEAAVLAELLTALNIDDAILFGHSDGGTIALLAASKYPERIKAVVVEAAHIFVEEVTLKGIREAMDAYQTTNLPERLAKYHGAKVAALFEAWTLTWTSAAFRSWNIEEHLSAIRCPLLFIQGTADAYGTLAQLEQTVAQVSGPAEKYIMAHIGHTPHKEAPHLVLERTAIFLNELL